MSVRGVRMVVACAVASSAAIVGLGCGQKPLLVIPPDAEACAIEGRASAFVWALDAADTRALAAANEKTLVAAYDCHGLRVLPACSADGGYATVPVLLRSATVKLVSSEEASLNAPASPGKEGLHAPLERTFSVAGVQVARASRVARTALRGACDGATHVITRIEVGPTAELAGAAIECVSPDDALVAECRMPVRVLLAPIGMGPEPEDARARPPVACPKGVALAGEKCTRAPGDEPVACAVGDADGCARACEKGSIDSCATLGWMRMHEEGGQGVPASVEPSRRACAGGHPTACGNAAFALEAIAQATGDQDEKLGVAIVETFSLSCQRGDGTACSRLGTFGQGAQATPERLARSAFFYARGCDLGSMVACYGLATLALWGRGMPRDPAKARALFDRACEAGEMSSCVEVAVLEVRGEGGPVDTAHAQQRLEAACKADLPHGCANLGVLFFAGEGIEQDFKKAAELFQKGCDGGAPLGCRMLGRLRERALGATRNLEQAAGLYALGCKRQDATSCNELGRMHLAGTGILKDEARAAQLFEQACSGGEPAGCHNFGVALHEGEGVTKDAAKAAQLFRQACDGGFDLSCKRLGVTPPRR